MPLFNDDEVNENLHKTSKELETTVITASDVTQTAITNNIAGYKWEVDYYNQIIGNGDEPKQPDVTYNITLQSYRKIENLEIIMSSPLTSTNPNELGGDGYININGTVHQHDIFIGKIHNNKTAIFKIEEVTLDTYEDNNIYKISFKLFGYSTDKIMYENIINKVATNYVYNNEYRFANQSPTILKKDAYNFEYGMNTIKGIMSTYFNKYYDRKMNYIAIEDNSGKMIDPYLNDFIIKAYSAIDYTVLTDINRMVGDRTHDITIFDGMFTNIDLKRIDRIGSSTPGIYYNSVYYKNVLRVAYSVDKNNLVPYFEDTSYFVSDKFYDGTTDDEFEILLYNFVTNKDIVPEDIVKQIDNISFDNKRLDCYKIPILCFIYSVHLYKSR